MKRHWEEIEEICPCCEKQHLTINIEENDSGDTPDFSWGPMECACADSLQLISEGHDWWLDQLWKLAEKQGWRAGEWVDDG